MGSLQQQNRYRSFIPTPQNEPTQHNLTFPKQPSPSAFANQSLSGSETDVSTSNENLSNEEKYVIRHTARQEPQGQENLQSSLPASNRSSLRDSSLPSNRSSMDVSSSSYNTLIIHSTGEEPWLEQKTNSPTTMIYSKEITEIPDDYLNQSSVLKHLAKEIKPEQLAPPPEYPNTSRCRSRLNQEKVSLSKSQPDLSSVGLTDDVMKGFRRGVSVPRPKTRGREGSCEEMWPTAEVVEHLIKENSGLKVELDGCYQKVSKAQKLEQEIAKVHKAHEDLVQSCERRERLERAARARLQSDCRRYQEINRALREQVDLLSTQMLSRSPNVVDNGPGSLRQELNKREVLIAQLITQNKELVAAKERQEIELAAQRATLQEQRTHIDILDTALTNAQANVVRLEELCRKKQVYVERVAHLQKALSSLQLASDKREQTERNLRLQLECELQRTKSGAQSEPGGLMMRSDSPSVSVMATPAETELKRRLRDKDEKIMRLEGECSKWEQRYLEESALRQAAIDAASIPKDAKIAALEKTSQETEKIIAEARNEKIRHMDEVHAAQKKVADLESRLKDMESKLAERDAMIKVLQKHTYDKDVSSMLGRSPHHTPHPSLGGADIDHVLSSTVSRDELVSSVLTNSTAYGSGNSYAGSDSSYHHMPTASCYSATKQSLDSQLKEIDSQLDSQLLSKRGLCCFPGFTNPVAAQRKGKIPKPLLAGVTSPYEASARQQPAYLLPPSRQDASLLEKQGRASQQQRMQDAAAAAPKEAPPSSLPRPPRRTGLPRRAIQNVDYSRLERKRSDGGDSLSSSGASSRRTSPARSLIPAPPRKLVGEYGRLSESGGSSGSLRKTGRDSGSTIISDGSGKGGGLFGGGSLRRGGSLGRDSKASSADSGSKYRIQF